MSCVQWGVQQHPRSAPTTSWEHSLPYPIAVTARMLFYIPRGEEGQVTSVSNQSRKYTHRWMERWLDGRGDRQVHRQIGGWTDDQTSDIPRAWSAFLSLSTAETWGLDQSLMGGRPGHCGMWTSIPVLPPATRREHVCPPRIIIIVFKHQQMSIRK